MNAPFPTPKFDTPILMIIFNRPEKTRIVFDAVRRIRPAKLYVAADGPRPDYESDALKCAQARQIVDDVDWACDVKTIFRDKNLRCGKGVSSAINWFFEHEEEGIILEDDCLPSRSFFYFCQELLERYRHDTRLMHIGGNYFLNGSAREASYSYYFSRNGFVWGWATWRRAWKLYDYEMGNYSELKRDGYFDSFFTSPLERMYRMRKFDQVAAGEIDTWDYQWELARFMSSGLAIVPTVNLVKNIGFDTEATHTVKKSKSLALDAGEIEFPLRHPRFVVRDLERDKLSFSHLFKDSLLSLLPLP